MAEGQIGDVYNVPWLVELSSYADPRSEGITAVGKGFKNGTTVRFWIDKDQDGTTDSGEYVLCAADADGKDIATCNFTLWNPPFYPGKATNYINAVDGRGHTGTMPLPWLELEPSIVITPTPGAPGDSINVQVLDLEEGDRIAWMRLAGRHVLCGSSDANSDDAQDCANFFDTGINRAGANGVLSFSFEIPSQVGGVSVSPGFHELRVDTVGGKDVSAYIFIATGDLQLSSANVLPNQRITVSGSGFTTSSNNAGDRAAFIGDKPDSLGSAEHGCPGETGQGSVTLGSQAIPWDRINDGDGIGVTSGGAWAAPIDLPVNWTTTRTGAYELWIEDCRGGSATADLTFPQREVTLTPDVGGVGSEVVITGKNFPVENYYSPTKTYEVKVVYDADTRRVEDVVAPDTLGSFTVSLEVPEGATVPSNNTVSVEFSDDEGFLLLETFTHRIPVASPDRDVLVALYNATGGANWTNNDAWLTNAPIGQWDGVTTDGQGRVTELILIHNQLKGEIPLELASLTNLKVLVLDGNELTGKIPAGLGSLANLVQLQLSRNKLTGPIPAELGSLANLKELWLSENQLTGPIPTELGSLANLELLVLDGNELTGKIPAGLGSLANLVQLQLSRNKLTGPIPAELGSLANLKELWLSENQLTGPIPTELGSLANLELLVLYKNALTGEIPVELGRLSNLVELHLPGNRLTGEIPVGLGNLASLTHLYLYGNQLTGEIPPELGSLTSLTYLYLGSNRLTGEIPSELGSLTSLIYLNLRGNDLTGEIPSELGSLTNLEALNLEGNDLTGEIPSELGSLTNLQGLSLEGNDLTGEIPSELGSLTNLQGLSLGGNQLTGEIPSELGNLVNLETMSLYGNQLTGEIPSELGRLTSLRYLYLNSNQLTGEIPSELGNLTNLRYLFLDSNQLTGEIPSELGNLTNLRYLYLDSNQLTGEIPSELGNLTNLRYLYLDSNQLTGEIPSQLGNLANLEWLYLAGNQLTGCVPASLRDVPFNDFAQLGLSFCPPGDPLIARYDANNNGAIDRSEVISAINDYLFGEGEPITRAEVIRLINLYLFGPGG